MSAGKRKIESPDYSDEMIARLYSVHLLSTSQIAERLRLYRGTVRKALLRQGIKPDSTRHRYDGLGGSAGRIRRALTGIGA